MTNPTLEKVAEALRATGTLWNFDDDDDATPMILARAALQSLRQVDDETVEAMADVVWRSFGEVIAYGSSTGTTVAEAAWTAAIDSILGQEP